MIPKKVSDSESDMLSRKISLEEIQKAIKAMENDKPLGMDGLPIEFYKDNLDWIGEQLLLFYNDAFDNGSLGINVNRGFIKLLPKVGDRSLVKNWRPITLLNLSYKIIAKLLARRIAEITKNIVSITQTGFIKGRYILENLITSWKAMNSAKASRQDVAMILVDFEKAYDRFEWPFVIGMLKAFGFPYYFCKWIEILFKDPSTIIEINGEFSKPIIL